jgi:hypothetical protein
MSRPKPTIILSHTVSQTGKSEQILAADAIYAVFYEGKPINLKSVASAIDLSGPKYKKSSFSNSGHAFNLAQRLNTLFRTDRFSVHRLTAGEQIHETEDDD